MKTKYYSTVIFVGLMLSLLVQPLYASWQVVQNNIGTKTYSVTMNFNSKWNLPDGNGIWAGFSVGIGTVTLPGGVTVAVGACAKIEKNPTGPDSYDWTGPGTAYWYVDTSVDDYAAKDGSHVNRRLQLVQSGESATLTVTVSGQGDRYANFTDNEAPAPWWLGINRRNAAADIMAETGVEVEDVLDYPTVTVSLGGHSFSYVSGSHPVLSEDHAHLTADDGNAIQITAWGISPTIGVPTTGEDGYVFPNPCGSGGTGTWDGANNTSGTTFVSGTYSRSSGVAEEVRTFTYDEQCPNGVDHVYSHPGQPVHIHKAATVGGGSFTLTGGYDNGAPDSVNCSAETTELCRLYFTDYCGPYDVSYPRDFKNMDNSERNDLHISGHEQHPTEHIAQVTGLTSAETVGHSIHTYTWDNNYIDLSSGPTIHYRGRWSANAFMPGGSQEFVDLPCNVTTGPINHGDLTADNIKDGWTGAASSYNDNTPGEPSHPGWQPWPDQRYDDTTGQPLFAPNGEPIWAGAACQGGYSPSENGFPWYDNQVLVEGGWTAPNALQVNLAAPGDISSPPLNFPSLSGWSVTGGTLGASSPYLTITTPSSGTATAQIADLLSQKIRLTGTRFAKVKWSASTDGAQATLSLGGNSWNLTAGAAGSQTTMIDLCSPDASTVPVPPAIGRVDQVVESPHPIAGPADNWYTITAPTGATSIRLYCTRSESNWLSGYTEVYDKDSNLVGSFHDVMDGIGRWTDWFQAPEGILKVRVTAEDGDSIYGFRVTMFEYKPSSVKASTTQSIIPFELPDDRVYDNSVPGGVRQPDSEYEWEFPAGWGVGRVVSAKLECTTPNTQYGFQCVQLYRKTPEEGGFAKLYVLPHQPSWNDSRTVGDWSWFADGRTVAGESIHAIRKAHLVVDGAVVLEIPAGTCVQGSQSCGNSYCCDPTRYWYHPSKLLPAAGSTAMKVLAYPVDDYLNPTCYATNGVATISTNLSTANDFIKDNAYVTYLVGGTYTEGSDNSIRVPLDITPDSISPHIGMLGNVVQGMTKRLRGEVQGLVIQEDGKPAANRQVRVSTPGAPSNQVTNTAVATNALGWFETPAINTKGDAALDTCVGAASITTRNRFASRITIAPLGLGSSAFEITDVNPFVAEPAYDDTVQINWRRTDGQSDAQSILVLKANSGGTVVGSDGVRYDLVYTITLGQTGQETQNPDWNPPANPYRWVGAAEWQPPTDQSAGRYNVGVQYSDGTVQTKWSNSERSCEPEVLVAASVYEVHADDCSPFYPGAGSQAQSETTIHYTLSAQVPACTLRVGGQIIQGAGNASPAENTVQWDGTTDAQGDHCISGVYPISVTSSDSNILIGPPLGIRVTSVLKGAGSPVIWSQANSFDPASGEMARIWYRLVEPVMRPLADGAYISAQVYDETTATMVRTLADYEGTNSIENDGGDSSEMGQNYLDWDGTNDNGDLVGPGNYTVTIIAKDSVGCDSIATTVTLQVLAPPAPGLEAHSVGGNVDEDDTSPDDTCATTTSIDGHTTSGASVSWTDTMSIDATDVIVASGAVDPDTDGSFAFLMSDTRPGLHNVQLTTTNSRTNQTFKTTVGVLINSIAVTATQTIPGMPSFGEKGRFSPAQGQSLEITFTSDVPDTVDVDVIDPYDRPACIDPRNPIKASDLLNAGVQEKTIKHIWSGHQVNAGATTLPLWNGTDDNSMPVPAGPYLIRISRTNADGLLDLSVDAVAVVDSAGLPAPVISNVSAFVSGTTVAVSWRTSTPTTGAVSYCWGGVSPIAKTLPDAPSTSHVAYLPATEPNISYSYYVQSTDASGNSSLSQQGTVTTGEGDSFSDVSVAPVSDTVCDITWTTAASVYGRVEYATVDGSGGAPLWQNAPEAAPSQNHLIHLTRLSANAEYVYRVASSSDASFANANVNVSRYLGFVTKTSLPSVRIESPSENAVVSGMIEVDVNASDFVSRFSDNGISHVELAVGELTLNPSHVPNTSTYSFAVDTGQLSTGSHSLIACATDDFGNSACFTSDVYVDNSTRSSASRLSASAGVSRNDTPPANKSLRGCAIAMSPSPIQYGSMNYLDCRVWVVLCRADCSNVIHKNLHYIPGGENGAPKNYVDGIASDHDNIVVGAINGSFFDEPDGNQVVGDCVIFGHRHAEQVTGWQRWVFGINRAVGNVFRSDYETIDKKGHATFDYRPYSDYHFCRSNVGMVMRYGKPVSGELNPGPGPDCDHKYHKPNTHSTVAWSKPEKGRRHFLMVAFEAASWDVMQHFFATGGRLSRFLRRKPYNISNLDIDTVVCLDGGHSTELAWKSKVNGKITAQDDGPRMVCIREIPDFIGVWAPLQSK